MDRQTDRWTDAGKGRQKNGVMDTQKDRQTNGWTDRDSWMDGQTEEWTDGPKGRQKDGETDGQKDGQTDRQIDRRMNELIILGSLYECIMLFSYNGNFII